LTDAPAGFHSPARLPPSIEKAIDRLERSNSAGNPFTSESICRKESADAGGAAVVCRYKRAIAVIPISMIALIIAADW